MKFKIYSALAFVPCAITSMQRTAQEHQRLLSDTPINYGTANQAPANTILPQLVKFPGHEGRSALAWKIIDGVIQMPAAIATSTSAGISRNQVNSTLQLPQLVDNTPFMRGLLMYSGVALVAASACLATGYTISAPIPDGCFWIEWGLYKAAAMRSGLISAGYAAGAVSAVTGFLYGLFKVKKLL